MQLSHFVTALEEFSLCLCVYRLLVKQQKHTRLAWSGSSHCWWCEQTARPTGIGEKLKFSNAAVSVANNTRSFRGVAVFMQIRRDWGHALKSEIPLRYFPAKFFYPLNTIQAHWCLHSTFNIRKLQKSKVKFAEAFMANTPNCFLGKKRFAFEAIFKINRNEGYVVLL